MARPTKLTADVQDRIVLAVRAGNYGEAAARSAAIAPSTFFRWMDRGSTESDGIYRDFREAVNRAEAEAEVYAVAVVRRAMGGDWRAALAYLERRHPTRWRRHQSTELTGKDGGPIRTHHSAEVDLSKLSDEDLGVLEEVMSRAADPD